MLFTNYNENRSYKFLKPIFLFIFLLHFSNSVFTQTNNPCGATSLSVSTSCSYTSGTTVGATYENDAANFGTPGCGSPGTPDTWYSFVAPINGTVRITTQSGTMTDGAMALYSSATCATGTELACSDDVNGLMPEITQSGLTSGTTYYIRIWQYSSGTGTFNICITSSPANDECTGAYTVTANTGTTCTSQTAGTLVNATASVQSIGACGGTADDDVWFKFTATSTTMTSNINNVSGSTTDLYHTVYGGTCGSLGTEIICSDPNGNNLTGLTIGATYYIRIYSYTSTIGQTSTFDVCVLPTPPPPNNVTCNLMEPICSGSPTVFTAQADGSTAEAGPNYGCLVTQPNPSWYYLEIDNPGLLSIDITAASDVDFAIWGPYANLTSAKAACGTYPSPLDCSFSTSAVEQANVASTTNGQVYVLLVTNYASVTQIINIDQSSSAIATTNCAIVLPVGMSSYNVLLDREKVKVQWVTETELNNNYFDTQRSADGNLWETIAIKKGMGTTSTSTSYEIIDEKPLTGISYYRLKQVDLDGKLTFSPLKSIKNTPDLEFTIYPIPARDIIKVNTNNKKLDHIEIIDVLGNLIYTPYTIENGEYVYNISQLKKGVYTIIMQINEQKITRRLIKG